MKPLLFLVHRIPYPPQKGDKIRSYHLLKGLAGEYRVFLGAFVDDPADWSRADVVRDLCEESYLVPLPRRWARLRSLRALADGKPLTLPYFHDGRMARWTRRILGSQQKLRVLVFSSGMAPYVMDSPRPPFRSVLDFVDVDSDKWKQYAAGARFPLSWLYRREGRKLLAFERRAAASFDAGVFVSRAEADLFRRLAPELAARVTHIDNGVDAEFFSPDHEYPDPYPDGGAVVLFTGAMDYRANVDAVTWFAREVFPELRRRIPGARFYVVGSNPTEMVRRLERMAGVTVTGRVEDVRPYLAHARVSVAPLRIARGVQNKVLEAAAMARPVVASRPALEGLEYGGEYPLTAETPPDWVNHVARLLHDREAGDREGRGVRERIVTRYGWQEKISRFQALLEEPARNGVVPRSGSS